MKCAGTMICNMSDRATRRSTVPETAPVCGRCRKVPPSITCACAPDVLICRTCYGDHIFDPGEHRPTPLPTAPRPSLPATLPENPEFTTSDHDCLICGQPAVQICTCQHPIQFLCASCEDRHAESTQDEEHVMFPLRAASFLTTSEAIGRTLRRSHQFSHALEKLNEVHSRMDSAETEIVNMLSLLSSKVEEEKSKRIERLRTMRESFTRASEVAEQEIRDNIYDDAYRPSTFLGQQLLNYREECKEALSNVFQYQVSMDKALQGLNQATSLQLRLTDTTAEESREYARAIPILTSTSLRLYNVDSQQETRFVRLSEAICINETSSWMVVGSDVVASGHMQPLSAAVYRIALENGNVKAHKPMLTARYFHAMVYYARTRKYYVFGGTGGNPERYLNSCESYDHYLEVWTETNGKLREGRDCFNPVQQDDKYFIIGGRNSKSIELFSTVTEAFTQMVVSLPAASSTLALMEEGEILILQRDKALRWKLMGTELKATAITGSGLPMYSNATPLRCGQDVYILRCVNSGIGRLTLGKRTEPVACTKIAITY